MIHRVVSFVWSGSRFGSVSLLLGFIDDTSMTHLSHGSMLTLYAEDMLLDKPINSNIDF